MIQVFLVGFLYSCKNKIANLTHLSTIFSSFFAKFVSLPSVCSKAFRNGSTVHFRIFPENYTTNLQRPIYLLPVIWYNFEFSVKFPLASPSLYFLQLHISPPHSNLLQSTTLIFPPKLILYSLKNKNLKFLTFSDAIICCAEFNSFFSELFSFLKFEIFSSIVACWWASNCSKTFCKFDSALFDSCNSSCCFWMVSWYKSAFYLVE